jgi:hypothetical protein
MTSGDEPPRRNAANGDCLRSPRHDPQEGPGAFTIKANEPNSSTTAYFYMPPFLIKNELFVIMLDDRIHQGFPRRACSVRSCERILDVQCQ